MEKIGTGEGAQAYGHGLYFAENPGVAQAYRLLNGPAYQSPYIRTVARDALQQAEQGGLTGKAARQEAIRLLNEKARQPDVLSVQRQAINDAINNFDDVITPPRGHTYKVSIDAEPHEFLDWDKPLSQQSPQVREAASRVLARRRIVMAEHPWLKGSDIIQPMERFDYFPQRGEVEKELGEMGIKGIRYLDQGSRNATRWSVRHPQGGINEFPDEAAARAYHARNPGDELIPPKQTSNYVVFDDKIIQILEKGFSGPAMLTALTAAGLSAAVAHKLVANVLAERK